MQVSGLLGLHSETFVKSKGSMNGWSLSLPVTDVNARVCRMSTADKVGVLSALPRGTRGVFLHAVYTSVMCPHPAVAQADREFEQSSSLSLQSTGIIDTSRRA